MVVEEKYFLWSENLKKILKMKTGINYGRVFIFNILILISIL